MLQIGKAMMMVYLGIGAIVDYRKRTISMFFLICGTTVAFLWMWKVANMAITDHIGGFFLGQGVLLTAAATKEKIGFGDAWMILIMSMILTTREMMILLFFTFLFNQMAAVYYMIGRKWVRGMKIPFYPFLLIGYVGVLLS